MNSSRKHEIGVGILVVVAAGLLAFMSIKVGSLRNVGDEIKLNVVLGDAAGLSDGAAVRVAGVQIGQILSMGVDHDKASLSISVSKSAAIRNDAKVQVRARSILGEKYLEVTPQSKDAPLIADGATLQVGTEQTEIDELVNSLGPLVSAMDAEAVNLAMGRLSEALEDDPDRVARMFRDIDTILNNGATTSGELPELVSETRSTLSSVRQIANDTRPMLAKTDRIISKVDTATNDLPQITEDVKLMVQDTRDLIADSKTLMDRIENSTEDLEKVLGNLSEIDKVELRRLLREEGILIRLKANEVESAE